MATTAERDVVNLPQFEKQPFRFESFDVESSAPHQVYEEADGYHGADGYCLLKPLAILTHDGQHGSAATTAPVDMDKHWGTAFKVNVVMTIISAVCFGTQALKLTAGNVGSDGARRHLIESSDDENLWADLVAFLSGIVVTIAIAVFVTVGMIHSMIKCGREILFTSFYLCAAIMAFAAFGFAIEVHTVLAILSAAACVFILVMIRRKKSRIEFGAANLKVAATALKAMPWTIHSAVLMSLLQTLWCFLATIAAFGSFVSLESVTAPDGTSYPAISCTYKTASYGGGPDSLTTGCMCSGTKISDGKCDPSGLGFPLMIVWLVSLCWGCAVIKNVVAATVVGSVASWWFTPIEDERPAPVRGAFHRATHSSFGSLCKAAAVQSAIGAVMCVCRLVLCVGCVLSRMKRGVNYILSYTICFIGVYGLNLSDAGQRVRELFERRGVTAVANDLIVETGLRLLALSATVAYFLISLSLISILNMSALRSMDTISFWLYVLPLIFGFASCLLFVSTALEVVRSGFKAVFVCYVQDSDALAQNHEPGLHGDLRMAWEKMQTETAPVSGAAQSVAVQ